MKVLSVQGLKKKFRSGFWGLTTPVLKGVDFEIEPGTITGFLGANGAGKTTTIKCLLGLIFPDEGKVYFFGEEGLSVEARKRIGFLPEHPYFYDYLTGYEFLRFYGALSKRFSSHELDLRIDELLERVELRHAKKRALRDYSKGMLQRIGVAQALIHRPELVILDEPMSGLDPDGRHEVQEIIRETAEEGTAVFFSSHLLHDAERLCRNLVVMKNGSVIYQGTTDDLLERFSTKIVATFSVGERLQSIELENDEKLGLIIEDMRSKGHGIYEIRRQRESLEEAFVKMAYGE